MSRELDRQVAEKVMGWTLYRDHWLTSKLPQYLHSGWTHEYICERLGIDHDHHQKPFRPSERMDHAFLVVERMRELGFNMVIAMTKGGFSCAFTKDMEFKGHRPYAENGAEAICLAALKAVAGKEERG